MKIAYFDCIAGVSGDMILGALMDAGIHAEEMREGLARLHLKELGLNTRQVIKNGVRAIKVEVVVNDETSERRLGDIEALLGSSSLPEGIQKQAWKIFQRLAEVESGIHGVPIDQVHLHELGGVDTIADVVGALIGLEWLGIEQVYASPLPLGRGVTQSAHGVLPLPAPATLALLKGVPLVGSDIDKELVTPTGAAILTSLARDFGSIPAMTLTNVGYGAGSYDLPIPNVLRMLVGEQTVKDSEVVEGLILLETNIDDSSPEIYEFVMERLFAAGALDVTLTAVQMKKNRPATAINVLCHPADAEPLTAILYSETSTLGVRWQQVERHCLERFFDDVQTPYGALRVKVARLGSDRWKAAPEYEDCRRLAAAHNIPLREVYRAAEIAITRKLFEGE